MGVGEAIQRFDLRCLLLDDSLKLKVLLCLVGREPKGFRERLRNRDKGRMSPVCNKIPNRCSMPRVVRIRALKQAHMCHAHFPGQFLRPAFLDGGVASPQEIFHS